MRLRLYEFEIERSSGWLKGYVAAPFEERAFKIIKEHESSLGQKHRCMFLERVDEFMPDDRRSGLDDMLEGAFAGFATYCNGIGWIAHGIPMQKLRFYKIQDQTGAERFIVAPNPDLASVIYVSDTYSPNDQVRPLSFFDGLADLPPEQVTSIQQLLEFGSVGIAEFCDDHGWFVR